MAAGAVQESLSSLRLTQRSPTLPKHRDEGGEAIEGQDGIRLQKDRPQQDRYDSSDATFLSVSGLNDLRSRRAKCVEDAISQTAASEGGLGFESNEVVRSSSARRGDAAAIAALQSLEARGEEGGGMKMRRRSIEDLIQVSE